jgi:ABC-2 type transport system permease protein
VGITAGLAVAAYVLNGLAPVVEPLKPLRRLSLFYHYAAGDPLRHGLEPGHTTVLVAVALVAAVLAPIAFERRDLVASA